MNNGPLHDDPLFRAVQERLGDYETPYNGADWDAMSRSLDQLPRTNRFRFRFSLNTMLALVGVAGAVAIASYFILRTDTVKAPPAAIVKPNVQPAVPEIKPPQTLTAVVAPQPGQETIAAVVPVKFSRKLFRTEPSDTGNLRFGDQIDPLKGFVRSTQEHIDSLNTPAAPPPSLTPFINKEIVPDTPDTGNLPDQGNTIPSGDTGTTVVPN
ncbi:MAG: hypothetical protein ACRC3B_16415 [Bacteroidia bacterium]